MPGVVVVIGEIEPFDVQLFDPKAKLLRQVVFRIIKGCF